MRRLREDDGVVLVLVGIMLVVLLAFAGLAVDLGRVYQERRQLRSGADAAALAVAEDCGAGIEEMCNDSAAWNTAQIYADANAEDGASAVNSLDLQIGTRRVRVVTSAVDAQGVAGVEVPFIGVVTLDSRWEVTAPATAVWGPPAAMATIPITISECEFLNLPWTITSSIPPASYTETVLLWFHDPGKNPQVCDVGPAGQDAPGGFGWLEPEGGECSAWVDTSIPEPGNTGVPFPQPECRGVGQGEDSLIGERVFVPLYESVQGQGSNTEYGIAGFGCFEISGYWFSEKYHEPKPPDVTSDLEFRCPGDDGQQGPGDQKYTCLEGHFERPCTAEWGDIGPSPDYGVVIVKLIE